MPTTGRVASASVLPEETGTPAENPPGTESLRDTFSTGPRATHPAPEGGVSGHWGPTPALQEPVPLASSKPVMKAAAAGPMISGMYPPSSTQNVGSLWSPSTYPMS